MKRTMNNSDINAALALFQSLYRSHKGDIFTIIERFILAGVKSKHLSTVTVSSVSALLKEQFNIDIPNSVIQNCINRQDVFQYKKGEYLVINTQEEEINALLEELNEIDTQNENIILGLYEEIERRHLKKLTVEDKDQIREVFFDFVKDRDKESDFKYFIDINQYIVKREQDDSFQKALDAIKEGMIIYHGIRYSETSNAKTWNDNIIFFLDMEYLFNAFGMNGSFYEECFYDFYNLVKEINEGSPLHNGIPRIQLKFFPKTKENIDRYFAIAGRIKKGEENLFRDKDAMINILNNSADEVGVLQYKVRFFKKLDSLGITEYLKDINLEKNKKYIFDTEKLAERINKEFSEEDKNDIDEYLLFADYINILREGRKFSTLDKCGFIFLSESKLSTRFSKFLRENDIDSPSYLICKMSLFTEDMWFKLRKGIVNQDSITTLKVISKAKSIVSGLLSESVSKNYKKIVEDEKDPEEKKVLYAELRNRRHTPENVTHESIDEDVSFIRDEDFIANYKENQSILKNKANKADDVERQLGESRHENQLLQEQNKELLAQLSKRNYENLCYKRKKAKRRFIFGCIIYSNAKVLLWCFVLLLLGMSIILETNSLKSPFGITSGLLSILTFFIQIFCDIDIKAKRFMNRRYRKYINRALHSNSN